MQTIGKFNEAGGKYESYVKNELGMTPAQILKQKTEDAKTESTHSGELGGSIQ